MKRNTILMLMSIITITSFTSCSENTNSSNSKISTVINSSNSSVITSSSPNDVVTYSVTFKNYDGKILEEDKNVPYGSYPEYNGYIPSKEGTDKIMYIFNGWTPSICEVKEDTVYTATFVETSIDEVVEGIVPVLTKNNTIKYGFYPQTYVSSSTLVDTLNTLEPSNLNGWYLYENSYYVKEIANVYKNESYTFDDGTSIVNGNEYWFKCEPIEWDILSGDNGEYFLLSSMLLDTQVYYSDYLDRTNNGQTIYSNSYEESNIRSWLNNEFYNTAFGLNSKYIQKKAVNNLANTTDFDNNEYACKITNDKVYLPSYQDYLNEYYGFDTTNSDISTTRTCRTTDYTRIKGAWCNEGKDASLKYNGTYWTRSPSSEYSYCAWNVNSGGYLSTYAVDGLSHSVRPCITISYVYEMK